MADMAGRIPQSAPGTIFGIPVARLRDASLQRKLLFFAGEVIRPFAWVMAFGIFTGTFSSIYVASPILLFLGEKRLRRVESAPAPNSAAAAR